jgi:hypothetical protein
MFKLKHNIKTDQVRGLSVGGERPTAAEVEAVRRELAKVPLCFREHWRRRGGKCDVVPGNNASIHPEFSHHGRKAVGWAASSLLIAVGGDCPESVSYVFARCVDEYTDASDFSAWIKIYDFEKKTFEDSVIPPDYLRSPGEMFCCKFQDFYTSDGGRRTQRVKDRVGMLAVRFFERLEKSITEAVADEANVVILY